MPDPQPSAVAIRFAEAAMNVVPFITRDVMSLAEWAKEKRRCRHLVAIALDAAGVGKAVKCLTDAARFRQAESLRTLSSAALAALTGDDDA